MIRAPRLPLVLLLAYALLFGLAAFGSSVIAFDDHPGQLYRLWFALTHGLAPWTWNPGWWAGYPELQFYPPGFVYAGALLHTVAAGLLPVSAVYQALVWLAWLAPGVTAWCLLVRVLGDGWLALPGAVLTLTLSGSVASGVDGGVRIGMIAARLAWALLPLLVLSLDRWSAGLGRWPTTGVPLLAAIALTHPAHVPTAAVIVVLAALGPREQRVRRLLAGGIALAASAAVTGFWSVPLLLRLADTRALAWGSLQLDEALRPAAILLAVLAALALRARGSGASAVLARLPWAMLAAVALDGLVLEPAGLRWLPADRIVDGLWLGVVLAAGLTLARPIAALVPARPAWRALAVLVVTMVAAGIGQRSGTVMPWPREGRWLAWDDAVARLHLSELWPLLVKAPPGRILFVRSAVPLVPGTEWWRPHTHLIAVTPMVTGHAIINGTFTHPSPVAAAVYRGDAGRGPIRELVERLDGHTLFGRPLETLDALTLEAALDRLGVSTVVALDEDRPHLAALERDPRVEMRPAPPPFALYVRRSPVAMPEEVGPGRLRLIAPGAAGEWIGARIAYYPLWRATQQGSALSTRRGPLGDLEVRLRQPAVPVDLTYAPGRAEMAGLATSVAGLLAAIWLAITRSRWSG